MKTTRLMSILSCLCFLWLTGCEETLPTAPVTGHVTLQGKPLANYKIAFVLIDAKKVGSGSSGITDENGNFALSDANGKASCPVGNCRVIIAPNAVEKNNTPKGESSVSLLPKKAGDGSLTFDVPKSGTTSAHFDL